MPTPTIHLIANAHLDPVWLWDWREGLNEGIITVRTMLDLMDANPEMTFTRGEATIYRHIEETDPQTFARIVRYVESGRWDVVGGTLIQPDTNLPATETFARHFARGQSYLRSRFGKAARVAWAADSFGHSAGLPEVLAAAGMEGYAFSRPAAGQLSLDQPAFWWEGESGARVLGYRIPVGWYGAEREELLGKLDSCLALLEKGELPIIGCFYGLGNHGGGPTRRHLAEIKAWQAQHPDIQVIHSGLHRFFDALYAEANAHGDSVFPVHRGELNFCLRGCYASVAKYKFAYRKAENILARAERGQSAICAALGRTPEDLTEAWDAVLFNSFHDILPGSSIERAYEDQLAWLGGAVHTAQKAEYAAINALANRVETSLPAVEGDMPTSVAMLVWNPHPHPYQGPIELEASLDYRPIWQYLKRGDALPVEVRGAEGMPLPFQIVDTEHHAMTDFPWRKRIVTPVLLPPLGWSVITLGWVENPALAEFGDRVPVKATKSGITNGKYTVSANVGEAGIHVLRDGKPLFGEEGLTAITVEDPWGSWGGMAEEPESLDLSTVRETWRVTQTVTLESGPERAKMWIRLEAGNSRLDLTFLLYAEREAVDVEARVFWNERAARLKLVFPVGDTAQFEVPGAVVERGEQGEVPGGRWVRVAGDNGGFGFASDALYSFDCKAGALRAAVVRATRYATDVHKDADYDLWRPAVDCGELTFRFLMTDADAPLSLLAQELEQPVQALLVAGKAGELPRSGSLAEVAPNTLKVLALKAAELGEGWILRLQETAGQETTPILHWLGEQFVLEAMKPRQIRTWRLTQAGTGWQVEETTIQETQVI